jgi:hypothetical protein
VICCLCLTILALGDGKPAPRASDWTSTGLDCKRFAIGDLDADGFGDVMTVNGNRDLCIARSVHGWKAAPWAVLAGDVNPDAVGLAIVEADSTAPGVEVVVVEKDRLFVFSRYADGKLADRREVAAPQKDTTLSVTGNGAATVIEATAADSRKWMFRDGSFEASPPEPVADRGSGRSRATASPSAHANKPTTGESLTADVHSAPPYEDGASVFTRVVGDMNGDQHDDAAVVFTCTRPHEHRVVRVVLAPNAHTKDQDSDELTDEEERRLRTDAFDRDTDDDGLLDGWEVHGLPRKTDLGQFIGVYRTDIPDAHRDAQLNPLRQDVIVNVSYFEGVDRAHFRGEMSRVQAVYRKLAIRNPDGSRGLWVHFRELPDIVPRSEFSMPWWDIGNKYFPKAERGMMHWLQVTPWGGGQSSQTGDMGGAGNGWAVFSHEFGHQLSLSHEGDSRPGWCPLYPSLMNYAFNYSFDGDGNAIHFSDGSFRSHVLDERRLIEILPFNHADVKYLANWPYRFTLRENADGTTLIDWNQNGRFDEGEVAADVNYGGSTYCGIRREHEAIGSAPSLAYVGKTCYLVAADQTRDHLWIKSYQGDEKWSDKRDLPTSGSEKDPVLVGGPDCGLVLHHHLFGWHVTRFTDKELAGPVKIADLPAMDLNGCRVGDRILLVNRHADDALEYRWLAFKDNDPARPVVTAARRLETRSLVVPGIAVDPSDGRVLMVTSMGNSRGGHFCMRVTWLAVQGDALWEQETKWTRGEPSGNSCCSRPVVAFTGAGQLHIFHHGWPDATGQMIAYRTTRIGNEKLDDGWLTCKLYDEWTRSRVGVGFANGPQGAIFAYRWDAGGPKINWLQTAHNGFGIDSEPMRDFDDGAQIGLWGIRFSILNMHPD